MLVEIKNATYLGSNNRHSLIDLSLPVDFNGNCVVFIHGYKGYKDWGAWHLMEAYFTANRYGFCKFNMSHNGGTISNGIDFPDLKAFSENTYSYEKQDVCFVLNWLENKLPSSTKIHLIGHSRGGGIALLNAFDHRVSSVITLAAISSIGLRFSNQEKIAQWKKAGVFYERNTRTQQDMPILYQQVEDYFANKKSLDIELACKQLDKPILIIHGSNDEAVMISEGIELSNWTGTSLIIIENANHTFNTSHPWTTNEMSSELKIVCDTILRFIDAI